MKLFQILSGTAMVVALGAIAMPASANLLTNGSFETGDFTGWTQGGVIGGNIVATSGFDDLTPSDGKFFAALGTVGGDNLLSQSFADTAGATYKVSFTFASDGDLPNEFTFASDGDLSNDFSVNAANGGIATATNIPLEGNTLESFSFTGTGSDTLTFVSRNNPGFFALDNVSVTASVPEPMSWALMLVGFGGLGGAMRLQRKRAMAATA